ncbi:MAG TPA: hydantoinase B/oxoprolinase family protein, partial [Gammaproteobacteria bacterium]|nr:hydantoinase B/oxoprolinase family protein [Gammaproteobacteria bacterium]
AYLTPVLARHVAAVRGGLQQFAPDTRLQFMQSHGGLTDADGFRGCNSILSGPAGGVVGMAKAAVAAGHEKVIGFDMGGTSTDVSLYAGDFERTNDTRISGVRIAAAMLHIHTIAAGGGSIVRFADGRLQVGPDSAGALPGPAAYRNGGPATLTDANVLLGRIQREHFPAVFGPENDAMLDIEAVSARFDALAMEAGVPAMQLAEGALDIAVERMAQAIRQISTRRGIDLEDFTLCAFGGAGGQHACRVADSLGIDTVLIHPMAGVLSALGIGLAETRWIRTLTVERTLIAAELPKLTKTARSESASLIDEHRDDMPAGAHIVWRVHIRSPGADTTLAVALDESSDCATLERDFCTAYLAQFGYAPPLPAVVDTLEIELIGPSVRRPELAVAENPCAARGYAAQPVYFAGMQIDTPVVHRAQLDHGTSVPGPALVIETNSTTVVEPGWLVSRDPSDNLVLRRSALDSRSAAQLSREPDPVKLELFNNAFMHAAEQMGVVLQRAAHSVNIKERMDFSCAVFSGAGELIANAPHVPVHLGSMGETVKALLRDCSAEIVPGNVLMSNDPLRGGTHLPDVTVVSPVFFDDRTSPSFLLASRAHHADVGGMTPGSMPPFSRSSDDEGALFHGVVIVRDGVLQAQAVRAAFNNARIPARDVERNLADIQAQIAANTRGMLELGRLTTRYGLEHCLRYVTFMHDNAAAAVRRALTALRDGHASVQLDTGERIAVAIRIDPQRGTVCIDFSGTSATSGGNLNAPSAIAKSAVLYALRVLVAHDIPLNSGCLAPVELRLPEDSLVNPRSGVAVVGGNVETSQRIVDALFRAFGVLASSQGTMNNLTFGNDRLQYYETICGGAGASASAPGADAVHTHMTNSRLTDPEILESRFPVRLQRFTVREDSGGTGWHAGGNGVVREIEFLQPMTVALLSNCRSVAPHGING